MKFLSNHNVSAIAICSALAWQAAPAIAQDIESDEGDAVVAPQSSGGAVVVTASASSESADDQGVAVDTDKGADVDAEARPIILMGGTIDPFGGTIDPFGGTIDPFGGTIDPFGGTIDPFGGNINPFYGDVGALWGTIDPFGGTIDPFGGTIDPFGGNISPFYGQIDPFQGNIDTLTGIELPSYIEYDTFWNNFGSDWEAANTTLNLINDRGMNETRRIRLNRNLNALINKSETLWGEAVTARTGQSFEDGFLNPLFAKYGIGDDRKAGFLALTKRQRAQLVIEWFDGLMDYTGHDHVDHWMGAVNWTPQLTEIQGGGADSVIGILDSTITHDSDLEGKVFSAGGYVADIGGHGTGVASLLVAAHDGRGVFGIAPQASVATYNPFDHTGTASWADVQTGIISLKNAGASVINMSLGIKGWTLHPEWNNIFTNDAVRAVASDTVFVIAAGNDGSTQTQDIVWNNNDGIALLIVGSVNPLGQVSNFSNRPGTACLAETLGQCGAASSSYLRDHYLVAPGEMILLADGNGGLVRRSGTSFAAPLVSGAVTLLHDRWPWLSRFPRESADIILQSATDLGAPGVDDIYGHGLLNIEASQSPLDFNALEFLQQSRVGDGSVTKIAANTVLSGGVGATWELDETFMVVFEKIGGTQRDFVIPLSSRLFGQRSDAGGSDEFFQTYIRGRFQKWMDSAGTDSAGNGLTDVASIDVPTAAGWSVGFSSSRATTSLAGESAHYVSRLPDHMAMRMTNEAGTVSFNAGIGAGSMTLLGQQGFGLTSDYNAADGGVNPLLGLASGGSFMDAEFAIGRDTKIGFGMTERQLDHADNFNLTLEERNALRGQSDYAASAMNMRVTHAVNRSIDLSLSYASVNESNALLGVQSVLEDDMANGSTSQTLTFGANVALPYGFDIAGSATRGVTRSNAGQDQNIRTLGAVSSSAYAVSVGKRGIAGSRDNLRLSFSQPLHIENGTLEYSSFEVLDRSTGETGLIERTFDIDGQDRRFVAEFIYAAPIGNAAQVSLFGRADMNARNVDGDGDLDVNEMIAGGSVSFAF